MGKRQSGDRIADRTVVITGAARGIGLATARALVARGARVVIGDRDLAALESAVAGLSELGVASGHPLDVTDPQSFAAFLDKARTDGGGHVDVLINNAGVMPIGGFLTQTDEAIRTSIEVNFCGVLTGCRLALPEMVRRRSGHIINIASLAGVMAVPGQVVYAGTKFAVVGLSTALADEFAAHGIDVTVVMPPFTNTELISGTRPVAANRPAEPADIAAAIIKVLDKPKTHVSIPGGVRVPLGIIALLGPRGRRWVQRRTGSDRVFLDFDPAERSSYEDRAQHATGLMSLAERKES